MVYIEKLRVGSFFSGIGAFEKALTRLGIDYETVCWSENDKYASKSYGLIHNVSEFLNWGDITKIDETKLPDFDLMTWGFPCVSISQAGKQEGFINKDGNKTASGLYYDGLRILKFKKPKYSVIENVKALTTKKFKKTFELILNDLEEIGYKLYWQVLNAKEYGVPQNRERIFIISIRKDINVDFEFPEGFDNGLRLKDLLEDKVDEKYYINNERTHKMLAEFISRQNGDGVYTGSYKQDKGFQERDVSTLIDANYWKGLGSNESKPAVVEVGQISNEGSQAGKVYSPEGVFPTVCACTHGYAIGNIIEEESVNKEFVGLVDDQGRTKKRVILKGICPTLRAESHGNEPKIIEEESIRSCSMRTRTYMNQPQQLEIRKDGLSNAVTTVQKDSMVLENKKENEINVIGRIDLNGHDILKRVYDVEGISPTLPTGISGNTMPKILVEDNIVIDMKGVYPNSTRGNPIATDGIAKCLDHNCNQAVIVQSDTNKVLTYNIKDENGKEPPQQDRVYNIDGVMTALSAQLNGRFNVLEKTDNDKKSLKFVGGIKTGEMWLDNGKELSRNYPQGNRVYDANGVACNQTAQGGGLRSYTGSYFINYRIRKLTPKECFRLMDFDDEDYQVLKDNGISDTQIYKMAGNSICCCVLEAIFRQLFKTR